MTAAAEFEERREDALRRIARGLDVPYELVVPCRHGWWPLRRFVLRRKYRCLFCRATTRSPW